jgi:hypothetical protein
LIYGFSNILLIIVGGFLLPKLNIDQAYEEGLFELIQKTRYLAFSGTNKPPQNLTFLDKNSGGLPTREFSSTTTASADIAGYRI